mgnify:CR=1 FL=1
MLKINKILSKKIIFPLLLRGLFPFCHSRESGNLSPLTLRGAKQRSNLNLKGFSLIELMVAVIILAIAVLGIFFAFSSGWMGMADARDRTVATNYAREAMENVKNMDFEKIITTTKSVTDANKKYRVDVNVSLEETNLKKVLTVVSWKDRKGISKTVDTKMLVQYLEIFASDPAKIVLFTESYNIINDPSSEYSSTKVIAVIKDISGNTVTDWEEGYVTFEIISSEPLFGEFPGGLSIIDATPVEGRASTTFSSNGTFTADSAPTDDYYVLQEIKASVYLPDADKTVTDTITVRITDGPVKIIMDADPKSIKANTSNYSTITASIVNAAGDPLQIKDIFNDIEITFNAFGEGKFEDDPSTYTVTIPYNSGNPELANVTVNLYSTGNPGLVNILVKSPNLESDSTDVIFLGSPVAISISAKPNPIYEDETGGSTISVSLLDSNGYPTLPTDNLTVSLLLTDNGTGGDIVDDSLAFGVSDINMVKTTTFKGQTSTGTAIIDASAGGLTGASVTIKVISLLVPDYIKLEVVGDQTVPADGITTAKIKATVYDGSGKVVITYTGIITFEVSLPDGTIESIPINAISGSANIEITSSTSGTATVTTSTSPVLPSPSDPAEGVVVKFYGSADHIKLDANPTMVKADGIDHSTITAIVYDGKDNPVPIYEGEITFEKTDPSSVGFFDGDNSVYTTNGKATIKLVSSGIGAEGTATVTVSTSPVLPSPSDPVGGVEVEFYEKTDLILVDETTHYEGTENKIITFDVKVTGENIEIDEMKITWTNSGSSERFEGIDIGILEVWSGNNKSGDSADINITTLSLGETNIKLTFQQNMDGKYPIEVIFYPPVSGQYTINLDEPLP